MNLENAVRRQFAPAAGPVRRIGAEIELIAVTDEPPPRPAAPAVLAPGSDAGFRAAACPSFEPGGQLELSLFDDVGPNGRRMMRLTASLQVTVGLVAGAAGREQWLVANLAGPALDAADPVGAYVAFAAAVASI